MEELRLWMKDIALPILAIGVIVWAILRIFRVRQRESFELKFAEVVGELTTRIQEYTKAVAEQTEAVKKHGSDPHGIKRAQELVRIMQEHGISCKLEYAQTLLKRKDKQGKPP